MPVRGMSRVTPPTMTNTCIPNTNVRPAASSREKSSGARRAITNPRPISRKYSSSTAVVPSNPSSSPMAEKMKSVATSGISSGLPRPHPTPDSPPVPKANSDCTSWKPVFWASANGSSQIDTRVWTWLNTDQDASAPAPNRVMPKTT